jgi:hypothetical protein
MSLKWKTDFQDIDTDEEIFAVVETNSGARYFVCVIDENGTLVDLENGDDYGWEVDSIDRWVSLSELDYNLCPSDAKDNPPLVVQEK